MARPYPTPAFPFVAQTNDFDDVFACVAMLPGKKIEEVRDIAIATIRHPARGPYYLDENLIASLLAQPGFVATVYKEVARVADIPGVAFLMVDYHESMDIGRHILSVTMGDTSDSCFYGAFPLAAMIVQEQAPVSRSYQGTGDRVFVQSEQGRYLNTAPPNPRDLSTYDQFAQVNDATVAALQASSAGADSGPPAGSGEAAGTPGIFHRFNLLVLSLFRGSGPHSGEVAGVQGAAAGAAPASVASEPVPATNPAEAASSAAAADVVPAAASEASTASQAETAAGAPVPKFSGYPSGPLYNGPVHPLVLDDFSKEYRTQLSGVLDGYARDLRDHGHITRTQGIVAGRYAIVSWGCGAGRCNTGALGDLQTGQAYAFPFSVMSISIGEAGIPGQ